MSYWVIEVEGAHSVRTVYVRLSALGPDWLATLHHTMNTVDATHFTRYEDAE